MGLILLPFSRSESTSMPCYNYYKRWSVHQISVATPWAAHLVGQPLPKYGSSKFRPLNQGVYQARQAMPIE